MLKQFKKGVIRTALLLLLYLVDEIQGLCWLCPSFNHWRVFKQVRHLSTSKRRQPGLDLIYVPPFDQINTIGTPAAIRSGHYDVRKDCEMRSLKKFLAKSKENKFSLVQVDINRFNISLDILLSHNPIKRQWQWRALLQYFTLELN